MSRSATKSCVLCVVSYVFLFTFFSVFAEGVFVNAKMNFQVKKHGKYFGIYENYFSKNTKNKEIKRHKTQDTRHKTQDTTCRWTGQTIWIIRKKVFEKFGASLKVKAHEFICSIQIIYSNLSHVNSILNKKYFLSVISQTW